MLHHLLAMVGRFSGRLDVPRDDVHFHIGDDWQPYACHCSSDVVARPVHDVRVPW